MVAVSICPPCETAFTVRTDCTAVRDSLLVSHGRFARPGDAPGGSVITAERRGAAYCVTAFGRCVQTQTPLFEIGNMMHEHRQFSPEIFALHGGAVEHNGGAVLLLAPSTTGKTTLTAYLAHLGFGYVTDDCILLDRESFAVRPHAAPLHLREGGFRVLEKMGAAPADFRFCGDGGALRRAYTPERCVEAPLPLKRIFFIERSEHENGIREMTTTEKTIELLKSPITNYEMTAEYLAFISRLAKVPCTRLVYCDMDYVADVIKKDMY